MKFKNKNKRILLLTFLLIITFSGVLPFFTSYQETNTKESGVEKSPKLSEPITINSPADGSQLDVSIEKTHYPGTYSFDKEYGSTGTGITWIDYNDYPTCKVIGGIDGHSNVVALTSNENWGTLWDSILPAQVSGTIEWWVWTPKTDRSHRLILYDGETQGLKFRFGGFGDIALIYVNGFPIAPYTAYKWTHVRVDFECGMGNYQELGSDKFYVHINGIRYGPYDFINVVSAIDKVWMDTAGGENTRYIDAIGYSWDPNYNVGDNTKNYDGDTGDYPGTYSFENEAVGTAGTDIAWIDVNGYPTCEVIAGIDGHSKVVALTSTYGWPAIYDTISDQSSGTIEWWVRTPKTDYSHRLILSDGTTQALWVYFYGDGWIYFRDNTAKVPFTTYTPNTWTHVRVDFECKRYENYQGLEHDTFFVYINGIRYGPYNFRNPVSAIDMVFMDTGAGFNTRYIDAVGYSWDPNYNIGDNLKFNAGDTGDYPAMYGFENEVDGTAGSEIGWIDYNSYPTCEVISGIDGHSKVVALASNTNWNSIYDIISDQSSGTIEWWVKTPQSYYSHRLILSDGTTQALWVFFQDDGWIYYRDNTAKVPFTRYTPNTWTHVRVDFECGAGNYQGLGSDKFYVHINGIRYGPYDFRNLVSAIGMVFMDTGGKSNTRYIDAVGYSWDPNYNIGDNLIEGLLLEFTPDDFTTMSYQLDGGANINILGDTVIPMPDLGGHTIEVWGAGVGDYGKTEFSIGNCPIGSINRIFPKTDPAKLGYTFYVIDSESPSIQFKVSELESNGFVKLNLYIDNEQSAYWESEEIDINDGHIFGPISTPIFNSGSSHTVVIEIVNSNGNKYKLDYLTIDNCIINNYFHDDEKNKYYSTTSFKEEDETKDYLSVATNTLLTDLTNPDGKIDIDFADDPHFSTSLIAAIDNDIDGSGIFGQYFLHRIKYEVRMLDPNGNFLDEDTLWVEENDMKTSAEADPVPSNENDDVKFLFQTMAHLLIDYLPYIDFNYLYSLLIYFCGEDQLIDSTFVYFIKSDHFYIEWEDGIIDYGDADPWSFDYDCGIKPRNRLQEIGLWSHWQCNPINKFGDYQVEVRWEIEVQKYYVQDMLGFGGIPFKYHWIDDAFISTGSQYFNFEYINIV